jgi:hypothetical protein
MYNNDVGQESTQKFMKQTGDLKDATLYFASWAERFQTICTITMSVRGVVYAYEAYEAK